MLADHRLPYRPVTTDAVQESFDAQGAGADVAPPQPEKTRGSLGRAWQAWQGHHRRLTRLAGHLLPRSALTGAAQSWRAWRARFDLPSLLALLAERFQTSLLGDYRCLKPRPAGA